MPVRRYDIFPLKLRVVFEFCLEKRRRKELDELSVDRGYIQDGMRESWGFYKDAVLTSAFFFKTLGRHCPA